MDLGRKIPNFSWDLLKPNPNSLHWRKVITTDSGKGNMQQREGDECPDVTSTMDVEKQQHPESSLILEVYGAKSTVTAGTRSTSGGMPWSLACLDLRRTNQQEFGEI